MQTAFSRVTLVASGLVLQVGCLSLPEPNTDRPQESLTASETCLWGGGGSPASDHVRSAHFAAPTLPLPLSTAAKQAEALAVPCRLLPEKPQGPAYKMVLETPAPVEEGVLGHCVGGAPAPGSAVFHS